VNLPRHFVIEYRVPYQRVVRVGVEADSPDKAIKHVARLLYADSNPDDEPSVKLLHDDYEVMDEASLLEFDVIADLEVLKSVCLLHNQQAALDNEIAQQMEITKMKPLTTQSELLVSEKGTKYWINVDKGAPLNWSVTLRGRGCTDYGVEVARFSPAALGVLGTNWLIPLLDKLNADDDSKKLKLSLEDLYDLDAGLAESIHYAEQEEVIDVAVVARLQGLRERLTEEMEHLSSALDEENLRKGS